MHGGSGRGQIIEDGGIYRTPRILNQKFILNGYEGHISQLVIADLGHEEPFFLFTNQLTRPAPKLVKRYAQRMIIENNIEDGIDFFHMDALSSAVAMKVNLGLQITLMASSLYRLFSSGIGNGHEKAKSRHIFRDSIDSAAMIMITEKEVIVRFQKRAHNPFLIAPDFDKIFDIGNQLCYGSAAPGIEFFLNLIRLLYHR